MLSTVIVSNPNSGKQSRALMTVAGDSQSKGDASGIPDITTPDHFPVPIAIITRPGEKQCRSDVPACIARMTLFV